MRPLTRGVMAIAFLIAFGISCLPGPVTAHPYHLQVANEIIVGTDDVDSGKWLAESFLVPSTFPATRVSVYVADVGASDVLGVSLRVTVGGVPSARNLTHGVADSGST